MQPPGYQKKFKTFSLNSSTNARFRSWVFRGTRVPVVALFEHIGGGASVEDFLSWFPGVTREQVEAVLECAIESLRRGHQAA